MQLKPAFLTLADVRQLVADKPPTMVDGNRMASVANKAAEDWDLSVGYDGAADLLRHGWPEGVRKMKIAQAKAPVQSFEARDRLRLDFAGNRVLMPAFMAGDMRCMIRRGSEPAPRPFLRVAFCLNASAKTKASDVLGRAIAYCELVQQLEQSGVDVEVYGYNYTQVAKGNTKLAYLLIKPAGQHVQPDIFLVALGHPAFYRRCFFRVFESDLFKDAFPDHPIEHAYGYPIKLAPSIAGELAAGVLHYDVMCGRLEYCRRALAELTPIEGKKPCDI